MEEATDCGRSRGQGDKDAYGVGQQVEGVARPLGGKGRLHYFVGGGKYKHAKGYREHYTASQYRGSSADALVVESNGSGEPSHHYGMDKLVDMRNHRQRVVGNGMRGRVA